MPAGVSGGDLRPASTAGLLLGGDHLIDERASNCAAVPRVGRLPGVLSALPKICVLAQSDVLADADAQNRLLIPFFLLSVAKVF